MNNLWSIGQCRYKGSRQAGSLTSGKDWLWGLGRSGRSWKQARTLSVTGRAGRGRASVSPRQASPDFALGLAHGPFWLRGSLMLSYSIYILVRSERSGPTIWAVNFILPACAKEVGSGLIRRHTLMDKVMVTVKVYTILRLSNLILVLAQVIRATADRRRPVMHGLWQV